MPDTRAEAALEEKVSHLGKERLTESRRRFRELREYLKTLPQTPEMALAMKHLQTAALFANATIALTDPEAEMSE